MNNKQLIEYLSAVSTGLEQININGKQSVINMMGCMQTVDKILQELIAIEQKNNAQE